MSNGTILFVDDEIGVLKSLCRLCRREGINVLTASSGADGLALLAESDVQVVVADQRMPGMSGTEFMQQVRERHPHAIRCILSGYAELHAIMAAINDGHVYRFIAKPWDDAELVQSLVDCLDLAAAQAADRNHTERLARRARSLTLEREEVAHMLELQQAVLQASRDMLDSLPVAVAAVDRLGRMMYTNSRFVEAFGDTAPMGQCVGEPWLSIATEAEAETDLPRQVDADGRKAHVSYIEIGGERHALIVMPPNHPIAEVTL
ncbi:MAG: response regulator [Pseudomonadota bacterium]